MLLNERSVDSPTNTRLGVDDSDVAAGSKYIFALYAQYGA
jgi:hypothetical protein